MDTASLQAFLAVAELGSFSRAAQQIFLTQPAVSKRIRALETELKTRLFDRIGRRIRLTPAGAALATHARRILGEIDDARRSIANLAGTVSGTLAMATSHHIGLHRLPPALKRFHATYPEVQLDLRFLDSEKACQAVARAEIELAVVTLPPHAVPPLRTTKVWDDPLAIVVSPEHPLAKERVAPLRRLLDYPAILPGAGTYTHEIILKSLGTLRERLRIGMTTNYLEVLKMLAAIGLGWSALPHTMIDESLEVVHINKNIRRELGIVTHTGRTLSNAASAMIRIVREVR